MADIKELFSFQKLLYVRRLEADSAKKTEKVFVAWLMIVIFIRFLANTGFAFSTLAEKKMHVGISLTEFNMFHLLLLWLLIPSVISGIIGGESFLPSRCTLFPISRKEIFVISLRGIIYQPIFWLLGAVSLIGFVPLLLLDNIVSWLFVGISLLCFFISGSILLSFLFLIISNKPGFGGILSPVFKIMLCLLLFANFTFFWGNDIVVLIFNKSFTLFSRQGNPSILALLSFLRPSTYLMSSDCFCNSLIIISCLLSASALCLLSSFFISQKLAAKPQKKTGRKPLFHFFYISGKTRRTRISLFTKELISILNTIEVKASVIIMLFLVIYLLGTPEVNQISFSFTVAVIMIFHAPFYFNAFGLDQTAAARYHLFPVTSNSIISAKNMATLVISGVHIIPLLFLNMIKTGSIRYCVYFSLIIFNMTLVYFIIGNITSILLAKPRRYSHFGAVKDNSSGEIFLSSLCWGGSLYVHHLLHGDLTTGIIIYAGFFVLLVPVFLIFKKKAGRQFEEGKEEMQRNLLI